MIYIKGLKQKEAAEILELSLTNVKARIRRAKDILKQKFNECCKDEFDKEGKLIGESNCSICKSELKIYSPTNPSQITGIDK